VLIALDQVNVVTDIIRQSFLILLAGLVLRWRSPSALADRKRRQNCWSGGGQEVSDGAEGKRTIRRGER
jgi:hypothetical protein